ncbi:MAG: AAA family ATPase [Actinobacteria bacterium]|nr:AAA family ATPase [Actinomycetota bacterium]
MTRTVVDPGTCRACAAALTPGARFCATCGAPVTPAPAPAPGERRVVTILFADLAGFTALAEGRDPEAVKELLDRCFAGLVPVVQRHGGTVDKLIGDELMATFGAPVAHEDDPERAVRAALGLRDAIDELAPGLSLRIGVNTGEVLAGPVGPGHAYTVTGDAVNTAHRLVGAAAPGEVLVGERTWARSVHTVEFASRPPFTVRGKRAPVRAWAAVRPRAVTGEPSGAPLPFLGREAELAQLTDLATAVLRRGQSAAVLVTGEPGVGKTRLARELVSRGGLGAGARSLRTTCPPYGEEGMLEPVAQLLRTALGIDADAAPAAQLGRIESAVDALPGTDQAERSLLVNRAAQLLGLHDVPRRAGESDLAVTPLRVVDRLVGAAVRILTAMARDHPCLVVVDDVQWADEAVVDLVSRLLARTGGVPLLVLALGRDDVLERHPDLLALPGLTHLRLGPLDPRTGCSLVAAALARHGPEDAELPGPEVEQGLLDASGGNPLLIEQLVAYLVETSALVLAGDRWRASADLGSAGLPDGIRALLGARLDALPADERHVLHVAALFGRRFWPAGVAHLVSRPLADVDDAIERLAGRGLLEPAPAEARDGTWSFRHLLTRDVAYASLALAQRARQHAAAARWLRDHHPGGDESTIAALLAHHYERAVSLNRELDHTDPGLSGAAFAALVRAGHEAERRDALREAQRWYARACELGSFDPVAGLEAELAHGRVLAGLRRLDEAARTFERVHRRAGAVGDEAAGLSCQALAWSGVVARLRGDPDRARDLFEEAARTCRAVGEERGEIEVLRLQGWAELQAGRARAAQPRLRRAAELADGAGGPDGALLLALGWSELFLGDLTAAQEHLWEGARLHALDGDQGGVTWCFGIIAFSFLVQGRIGQAHDVAANLLEWCETAGDAWQEGIFRVLLAACHAGRASVRPARALAAEAQRAFEEMDDDWGRVLSHLVLAMAARADADAPTARAELLAGLAIAGRVAYVREDARLLAELAAVEAEAGDVEAATRRARGALAMVRAGLGDHDSGLRALTVLGRLAFEAGDLSGAQLLLEEAVDDGHGPTDSWRQAAATLAEVRAARGDAAGAGEAARWALNGSYENLRTYLMAQVATAAAARAGGEPEVARQLLTDVLADHRDAPPGLLAAGRAAARGGQDRR